MPACLEKGLASDIQGIRIAMHRFQKSNSAGCSQQILANGAQMKIGFVQSGAIGDIVIALPAAKWYVDRGYDVFWPIDHRYVSFFQRAAPYVNFLTVPPGVSAYDWHLGVPKQLLADLLVDDIFTLYLRLESGSGKFEFGQPLFLPEALKFDEYKYAIADVPFSEKWNLVIHRDPQG
jgi:hypothetical protein